MIGLAALAGLLAIAASDTPLAVAHIRSFEQAGWTYDCFGYSDRLGRCIAMRKIGKASVKIKIVGYTADDDVKIEMTVIGPCQDVTFPVVIDRFTRSDDFQDASKSLFAGSEAGLMKCGALRHGRRFDGDFTGALSTLVALNEGERLQLQATEK